MKKYLYHQVPRPIHGKVIVPLTTLKDLHTKLYNFEVRKYTGREELMQQRIPHLNCLWNDVIFLAAADPVVVNNAFVKAGFKPMKNGYYQIDIDSLDHSQLVVYRATMEKKYAQDNFSLFDHSKMEEYAEIPQLAYDYYAWAKEKEVQRKNIFPYCFIPHILYKGEIDICECEIVELYFFLIFIL